jgi:phage terminase large subunit-like protein
MKQGPQKARYNWRVKLDYDGRIIYETVGTRVIEFIETYCVVPEGDLIGQPVILAPFQKKFILEVFDNPHGTKEAILSMARKNAKTALIAMIVLAFLVGPVAVLNSRIVSGALSRDQAAEVFNLASKMVRLSPELSDLIVITPSSKKLTGTLMNTEYTALSAEAKTSHGKSPLVVILDEVGQVVGPRNEFFDALTTAQGAYKNGIVFYISTQAANDSDMLSLLIDDAKRNKPPRTVCHVYAAEEGCDLLDEEQWKNANPALGLFRSHDDLANQAKKAHRIPSFENTFRNLNLNQRVTVNSPFINRSEWMACRGENPPLADCEAVYGGFDLSTKIDLTAFVLIGLYNGKWYIYAYFWCTRKGLLDRAHKDKAPYDLWHKDGYISLTDRATIDYEYVAKEVIDIVDGVNLVSIGFDRWRMDFFKKELENIGVELPIIPFGQGFKDMSPAVECLEERILNKEIIHDNNPVLNMCMANATVYKSAANDRKLDKLKTSGRIDGAVALVQACGVSLMADEVVDIDSFINDPLVL